MEWLSQNKEGGDPSLRTVLQVIAPSGMTIRSADFGALHAAGLLEFTQFLSDTAAPSAFGSSSQPVRVRGFPGFTFKPRVAGSDRRACMLHWTEPGNGGDHRAYFLQGQEPGCDDGTLLQMANDAELLPPP